MKLKGNVGIGTTSPATMLEVVDDAAGSANHIRTRRIGGATTQLGASDTGGSVGTITNHSFGIVTNNQNRVYVSTTGNVGIGTASPSATLDINGYYKLAKNTSQPVACSATYDGSVALTSGYRMCVCNGGTTTWVFASDGATACTW